MTRERRFSIWRSVSEQGTGAKPTEGFVRKRAKSLTQTFLSPWAGKWNTDPHEINVVSPPRRKTFENLHVFLRNNKVMSTEIHEIQEASDKADALILCLAIGTILLGIAVILILVLR